MRLTDHRNRIQVRLLCSKTRVAPLKVQTIPRLELCAALTLARLIKKVVNSLDVSFYNVIYWCDSTIVLNWLQMQPNKLQVFVTNRVAEIQELTDCHNWRHVPTHDNPADLLSRGLFPEQLAQSDIWWHGPSFLLKAEHEWPVIPKAKVLTMELRKTVCTIRQMQPVNSFIFEITTNFRRLIRIVAYCKRFVKHCRDRSKDDSTCLTAIELKDSLHTLAKLGRILYYRNTSTEEE